MNKKNEKQTGIVYLPIIMEQSAPKIVEGNFAPRMLLRSRYAVATIDSRFYTTLSSNNFPKNKGRQIFSEIDPFGEENWD